MFNIVGHLEKAIHTTLTYYHLVKLLWKTKQLPMKDPSVQSYWLYLALVSKFTLCRVELVGVV